jgi:hypothetical protein
MTPDRIEQIQNETAYPDSQSVKSALFTVWHETQLANEKKIQELEKNNSNLVEQIKSAHMAGQIDAGVDPSYANAQAYLKERIRYGDIY